LALAALALAVRSASASDLDAVVGSLPAYRPQQAVSGTLRTWGHGSPGTDFMGSLVRSWEDGFRQHQPGVRFEHRLYGTASAIGALYTGTGDLAIMGREILPAEISAFQSVRGYPPLGIEVLTGSFDVRNKDFALGVFVHRDNPIARLTLAQVAAVFGCTHGPSPRDARTWGDLGLAGEWADQPIRVYGYAIRRGFGVFFQDAVLGGSRKWNCGMKEFGDDVREADGSLRDAGQQVLDALARDRRGIAYTGMRYRHPETKALALAARNDEPYYEPGKETVLQRRYPLTRVVSAFVDRAPGRALEPRVKEYLRYILSREGQQAVVADEGYLPLTAEVVREQLRKLE
jgi:phosphate transport system substrate-binding protein